MIDDRIPFEYLLECSERGLRDAMVKRLEIASAIRKQVRELLEQWAEEQGRAMLFEWFLVHGSELMGRVTNPATAGEATVPGPGKPGPMRATNFRESLKKLLESA